MKSSLDILDADNLLFANIKSHALNEMEYLCDIFRRIGHTAQDDLVGLLAHKWQPVP